MSKVDVTVKIAVISINDGKLSKIQLFRTAFDGNDAFRCGRNKPR